MTIKSMFSRFKRLNTKKLVVAGVFLLAMAGSAGLGLMTKQLSSAASVRDTGTNPIMKANVNGGIGCLTAKECVQDLKRNAEGDLDNIYANPTVGGLTPDEYDRFGSQAVMGKTMRNGDVIVNGQVVMSNAKSMGRHKFNSNRQAIEIGGKTYYYSPTQHSFADGVNSIDTLVLFGSNGVVETAIMTACGNPVWGDKPKFECSALKSSKISGDTYEFWTEVSYANGATVKEVVYEFGDGTKVTTKNPAEKVRHTYATAGTKTAKVTVHYNLPGKKSAAVTSAKCKTEVTIVKPFYLCEVLQAVALNDKKTQFRFTVKAKFGNGATLKDADFTLDGTTTVRGVTTKDAEGNIYKDYTFAADGKEHAVTAKVNFNVANGVQSKTCVAKVTPEKEPVCPVPGKEHLPPDSPECVENCPVPGKEHLPKGSDECVETPPELPKTGISGILGLFAGTTAFGAIAHRVVTKRRAQ